MTALIESFFIKLEIPSGPNLSIVLRSIFFQKKMPIFLNVLTNNPDKMPKIFLNMFKASSKTVIKFLSNKSNFFDDLSIIMKMPKLLFLKALI